MACSPEYEIWIACAKETTQPREHLTLIESTNQFQMKLKKNQSYIINAEHLQVLTEILTNIQILRSQMIGIHILL